MKIVNKRALIGFSQSFHELLKDFRSFLIIVDSLKVFLAALLEEFLQRLLNLFVSS